MSFKYFCTEPESRIDNRDFTLARLLQLQIPALQLLQPTTVRDPHAACSSIIPSELSMLANVQPRILSQAVFIVYN